MTENTPPATYAIAILLFFFSGAVALVYEVLWMKELSLLFGNSAQAAAATLAAFFSGIAAGNVYWGRRSLQLTRPLKTYAFLEAGVAVSAFFYFGVLRAYDVAYGFLFSFFADSLVVFTLIKFLLSFLLFFPTAFFMGGTLPVMTQFLVRRKDTLGRRASTLYGVNTFGAASGAFAAGFLLPQTLGYKTSYLMAIVATMLVAASAFFLARQQPASVRQSPVSGAKALLSHRHNTTAPPRGSADQLSSTVLVGVAALSGFTALGLQVLWIRMFSQVLHNSVYTYAAILSIFLLALALGSAIARDLSRRNVAVRWFMPTLLTVSGLSVAASPMVFDALTNGGIYVAGDAGFVHYMIHIVLLVTATIGPPVTILGIVLPYLFKVAETRSWGAGETVGVLVTANTLAAIAGSIIAGFLFIGWLGLWPSLRLMAVLYLAAALYLVIDMPPKCRSARLAPIAGTLILVTALDSSRLPVVQIDPVGKGENLLQIWEGADATVAVVRRDGHIRTKLNNWYTLGSTGDRMTQEVQAHLPMLLHEDPQRIFFLGLGTGITAGAALDYPVESVVVAEVAPSVIKASRAFFSDFTNGLYDDPRVSVIGEDGRNLLRGTRKDFDIIISDLFIPWKAGTGTLYSVEHYTNAQRRLTQHGLYAQWVPLYQVTQSEFSIIARSMLEVFPMVTLWRGNFWPEKPVVALIGHRKAAPISAKVPLMAAARRALAEHADGKGDMLPLLAHYVGRLDTQHPVIAPAPINTDNRPIIEYLAPINHRLQKAGGAQWFTGEQMLDFMAELVEPDVLAADPYIAQLHPAWRKAIRAGYYYHAFKALQERQHRDAAAAKGTFDRLLHQAALRMDHDAP